MQVPLTEREYAELEWLCDVLGETKAEVMRSALRAKLRQAKRVYNK